MSSEFRLDEHLPTWFNELLGLHPRDRHGIIVACNGGGFGFFGDGGLVVDSGRGVTSGGGMCWAAPAEGSGDVRCRALCGNQDGMWVAPELTITEASEITTNTQHLGTITRQLV